MKNPQVYGDRPLIRLLDRTKRNNLQRSIKESRVSTVCHAKYSVYNFKKKRHIKTGKCGQQSEEKPYSIKIILLKWVDKDVKAKMLNIQRIKGNFSREM